MSVINKTIDHVGERLDRIALFVVSPDVQERFANEPLNPLRALVLKAIVQTPKLPRFIYDWRIASPIKAPYAAAGLDVIGVGHHVVTLKDGEKSVRKIHPNTAGLSEPELLATIQTLESKRDIVLTHFGKYAVHQDYEIIEHPLEADTPVISAAQPFINARRSIDLVRDRNTSPLAQSLSADISKMHEDTSFQALPDFIGNDNLLVEKETGAIRLVDPIALLSNDENDSYAYSVAENILKK